MPEPAGVLASLPYVEGRWRFHSRFWKQHLPDGLTFRFGLGTASAAALASTMATLGLLDYLGVVDAEKLWNAILSSLPQEQAKEGGGGGGSTAADWLNALVPITALDNLLRGK